MLLRNLFIFESLFFSIVNINELVFVKLYNIIPNNL